jgi:putative intracellular protease/amidase
MAKGKIVIPLPSYGFDPTEAAIPWKILSTKKFDIVFATPDGQKPGADIKMLTGRTSVSGKKSYKHRKRQLMRTTKWKKVIPFRIL